MQSFHSNYSKFAEHLTICYRSIVLYLCIVLTKSPIEALLVKVAPSTMQEKACKSFVIALLAGESPRSKSLRFFLWGLVKDKVSVPPPPQDSQEMKQRITNVLNALTRDLLHECGRNLTTA
ncbi:hypothetical protein AVEN_165818-1 [Araneus ventricosus]|uniref:Uncharacterized protein n=1 Tax=Araneus ventricosus TaxID=182803 RepID=A0A4Y2EPF7_ARAVE|nr:hypothetical protein AVEN_165818-1 [Araneus ventricosus]